jgi:hypothetical protein
VCSFTFEGLGFAKTNDTERRDAGMNGLARQCTVSCSTSVPALKPDISLAKADDLAHRLKPPLPAGARGKPGSSGRARLAAAFIHQQVDRMRR